jgi:hypothetical protein
MPQPDDSFDEAGCSTAILSPPACRARSFVRLRVPAGAPPYRGQDTARRTTWLLPGDCRISGLRFNFRICSLCGYRPTLFDPLSHMQDGVFDSSADRFWN